MTAGGQSTDGVEKLRAPGIAARGAPAREEGLPHTTHPARPSSTSARGSFVAGLKGAGLVRRKDHRAQNAARASPAADKRTYMQ